MLHDDLLIHTSKRGKSCEGSVPMAYPEQRTPSNLTQVMAERKYGSPLADSLSALLLTGSRKADRSSVEENVAGSTDDRTRTG